MVGLAPLRGKLTLFRHSGSVKMTDKVDDRAFCPTRLQRLPPGYFLPSISNGSVACLVVHSTASGETALRRLQQGLLCPMPHSATAPSLALVLDANQRSALAATRSLGSRGVALWTSDATDTALAGRSRFSRRYLRSPSPEHAPEPFMDWLVELVAREGITFLLPVTEISSQLILRHRQRLPGHCALPFAELDQVMALADKGSLVQQAMAAGVRCPATRQFVSGKELDPASIDVYPVVLKPRLSRVFLGDRWLNTSVALAGSRGELQQLLAEREEFRDHPFLLQEFIPGHGAGIFALYDRGRPVAFFAHRRLREKPPGGGVSVLSESVDPDPAALTAATRLLDHAGWHGVAMVEFRVSPDGTPWLMEVNTRFWGSLQLAIDAGVDFPWLLYQLSLGRSDAPAAEYRRGRRLRWWLGDADRLYLVLRDGSRSLGDRLGQLLRFALPDPGRTRHEIWRWRDPGPAWYELREWLQALRG